MQFELSASAQDIRNSVDRWVQRQPKAGRVEAFGRTRWHDYLAFDLLAAGPDELMPRVIGIIEAARAGIPGPVLEAQLALLADRSGRAAKALADGKVVTSVAPGPAGPILVGWGAAADLVIDQTDGAVLAEAALPAGDFAYPVPHGWYERRVARPDDPLAEERWRFGAALLAGLSQGALELTVAHVKTREQFGNILGAYQAVQFPLAECKILVDGARLTVIDAAARAARGEPSAKVAAALSFLAAAQTAERVTRTCHQAFGASGFCNETGLVEYTWAMSWIRLGVGAKPAQRFLAATRSAARQSLAGDPPGCRVLEGFMARGGSAVGDPVQT